QMWAVNVRGTENICKAALEENVEGFVHTSSTAAVATGTLDKPANEETPYDLDRVKSPYHTTKHKGEELVLGFAKKGLPAKVVNPSTMFGPWDVKPTSGLILQIIAKRGIPFYTTGSNNFIDVEDAALGHLLAMEKGRVGQRYILGNQNMAWKEFLTLVSEVVGKRPPKAKLIKPVALAVAYLAAPLSKRSTGALAWLDPATVRGAFAHHCVDPSKARRELGLPRTPVREAVEKEYRWLKENGYLNGGPRK
ncbi:MAG: NAD-dependent epimerase/dehydratase family protein, partial [Halobacteria archaeon]